MQTDIDIADHDAILRLVATLCATRLVGLPLDDKGELTALLARQRLTPEDTVRIRRQMDTLLFTFRRVSSIHYQLCEPEKAPPGWLAGWHLQGAMPHHPGFTIGLTKYGKFSLRIRREWCGQPQELFSGEGLTLGEIAMHVAVMIYGSPEGYHLVHTEEIPGFWDVHAACARS